METNLSQYWVCAVTGHRPNKLGGYGPSEIQTRIRSWFDLSLHELLKEHPNLLGISGMALGCDSWFAETCIELDIPFVAAVPFPSQASRWPQESRQEWEYLCQRALEVVYVSPDPYAAWKMQTRNIWMIDRCQRLLAVYIEGEKGGTRNALIYANDHEPRVDIKIFNPKEL